MIYNLCLTLCGVDFRFVVAKPNLNDKMKLELLCSQPFGHCGFRNDHSVNLYTSPDLEQWTFAGWSCNLLKRKPKIIHLEGDIFPVEDRPEGIYFRPKVSCLFCLLRFS